MYIIFPQQFQSNETLFEAVEHQELDLVQLLLSQYSLEELDLNTPNSEGLLPLDIAIMTNNVPMAKLLLRAGAKESPHCELKITALICTPVPTFQNLPKNFVLCEFFV